MNFQFFVSDANTNTNAVMNGLFKCAIMSFASMNAKLIMIKKECVWIVYSSVSLLNCEMKMQKTQIWQSIISYFFEVYFVFEMHSNRIVYF